MRSALIGRAVLAVLAVSAPVTALERPTHVERPTETARVYRVDPADGSLTPLDYSVGKKYLWSERIYAYLKGVGSPLVIPFGTPLVFAFRAQATEKNAAGWEKVGPSGGFHVLELLMVHQPGVGRPPSDDGRRYVTGQFVPMHHEAYGPRESGSKPNLVTQTFLFWPEVRLGPGEYVISNHGLQGAAEVGVYVHEFAISATEAAVRSPSPSTADVAPVTVATPPPAGTALVTIESSPSNAEVTVDGDFIGTTPLTGYRLNAGIRRLVVTKKGYGRWTRDLKVTPGVDTRLLAELERMSSGD